MPSFRVERLLYAGFSMGLIAFWPVLLILISIWSDEEILPISQLIPISIINILIFIIVVTQSSSNYLTFYEGFVLISEKYSSGCANITILYMPIIHFLLYLVMILITFIGLLKGKDFTQDVWQKLIFKLV